MNLKNLWELLKQTFKEWGEDKASRLAAALAYYAVFSIPPLLLILLAVLGQVLGAQYTEQQIETRLISQFEGLIGGGGAEAIASMIENASRPEGGVIATVVGVVTLIFGASGVFAQLQDAMDTIWEVMPDPDQGIVQKIKDRFLSFTMVGGIAFLLLVSLVVSTGLSALNEFVSGLLPAADLVVQILNFAISLALVIVLFAAVYKVIPDVTIQWRDVWVGAIATGVLFTIGKLLISLYLARSAPASSYGAAGSLVILLLWVYYSASIFFLGAEFTQVYANRYGSRIVPDADAVPLTEEARAEQGIPTEAQKQRAKRKQKMGVPHTSMATATARRLQAEKEEEGAFQYYTIAFIALVIGFWRWLRS